MDLANWMFEFMNAAKNHVTVSTIDKITSERDRFRKYMAGLSTPALSCCDNVGAHFRETQLSFLMRNSARDERGKVRPVPFFTPEQLKYQSKLIAGKNAGTIPNLQNPPTHHLSQQFSKPLCVQLTQAMLLESTL